MSTDPMTPQQLRGLVAPTITESGYDIDDLSVAPAPGGGSAVTIVVDRDGGAALDALATLTRRLVETLDAAAPDTDYVLEITTPGIDRPLTEPRHWRRAQGRKVDVEVIGDDGTRSRHGGRIGVSTDDSVELVRNDKGRFTRTAIDFKSVTKAVVQVDFNAPKAAELEMCGLDAAAIGRLLHADDVAKSK